MLVTMLPPTLLILLALTTALPLNINLGAYSPALVVGDGAISFEGAEGEGGGEGEGNGVNELVGALQGAAVAGVGAGDGVAPPAVQAAAAVEGDGPSLVLVDDPAAASLLAPGPAKALDPRL